MSPAAVQARRGARGSGRVGVFVTIWAGHALTRIVARSLGSALVAAAVALRSALDRWPDPGTA